MTPPWEYLVAVIFAWGLAVTIRAVFWLETRDRARAFDRHVTTALALLAPEPPPRPGFLTLLFDHSIPTQRKEITHED